MTESGKFVASQSIVARQPIFDPHLRVAAFELLYRTPGATEAMVGDPTLASAEVVVNATLDIGFAHLVGALPAFINFPAEMLKTHFVPPLVPQRVVVEVLEGSLPDDELLASLRNLRTLGFQIALDDYDIRKDSPRLLEQADIVKVDIRQHTRAELEASLAILRRHPLRLVAEKVETREELAFCRSLGFDLYQGYFLHRPEVVQARRACCSRMSVLEIAIMTADPKVEIEQVERAISRDVGLGYRVLRCINSSYFGVPREIRSIRQAVVLLGTSELQKLCWLMLMAGLDGQPAYICVHSLHRARMCEALSQAAAMPGRDLYFLAGMLSTLDVLLQQPMEECIASLPLGSEVRNALLGRHGDLGAALRCAESFERGDWEQVNFKGLSRDQVLNAYLQSAEWADGAWGRFSPGIAN